MTTGGVAAGVTPATVAVVTTVTGVPTVAAVELVAVRAADGVPDCGTLCPHRGWANVPKLRQRLSIATVGVIPVGQAGAQKFPRRSPD